MFVCVLLVVLDVFVSACSDIVFVFSLAVRV